MRTLAYDLTISGRDVMERLRTATDPLGLRYYLWPRSEGRLFVGAVSADRFRVHLRHGGRASFAPWAYGNVVPMDHGSRVMVRVGLNHIAYRMLVAILVMLAASGLFATVVTGRSGPPPPFMTGLGILVLAVAGIALAGWSASRREADRLTSFFDELFSDARASELTGQESSR